jgi:hypothetical protein
MPAADSPRGRELERSFVILAWVLLALTVAKGFRVPGRWGATHFAFNYSQGFVRRGLVGEIARRVGGDDVYRYNTYVIFSCIVILVAIFAMAWLVRRALRIHPGDLGFRVALLVFVTSPAVYFLAHVAGYFEWIGFAFVLLFLAGVSRSRHRFAVYYGAAALGAVLTLIHEGMGPMFGPAICFVLLCHIRRHLTGGASVGAWVAHLGHSAIVGLLLVVPSAILSTWGTDQTLRVEALRRFLVRHTDYVLRPDAIAALTRSSYQNMTEYVPWFWEQQEFWPPMIYGQIAFVPGFLFVLFYGCHSIWRSALRRWQRWTVCLGFLCASVAPELLNLAGWDWQRWNSVSMLSAATCALAFKLLVPAASPPVRPAWLVPTGLVFAALGLASTTKLFDAFEVQLFPF